MFTATNQSHNEEFLSKRDIQGGFYARTFIIHENKRQNVNSLVVPPKYKLNKECLVAYLKQLAILKGEFTPLGSRERTEQHIIPVNQNGEIVYMSQVGKIYDDWYNEFSLATEGMKDETGTVNRFGDAVLKVAMLISLTKRPVLEIDSISLQEAISQCEKLIGNVRKTTMGSKGKSSYASQMALVLEELIKRDNHTISRVQLNKQYWMHAVVDEWDMIMKSIEASEMISIESVGNQIVYKMNDSQVTKWRNFLEGRTHE
jgi:hypothetical protein